MNTGTNQSKKINEKWLAGGIGALLFVMMLPTQSKIINLAIGLTSIFVGGLSLFIIAQTGLIAACAAITALALHEYVKNQEIGKEINDKFDKVADDTINFIVSSVEKLIPTKPPGITA
ncbi:MULTISPECIES: hypothetical protein [unclassified Wolbachia]|uniref:hypothetical protein n=1 Tax=unclassified Wolbachia TaxID=2640676 RepID=UPI00223125E7|nr:hypothetical protein [Wolbachia endosymbiont (group A) of Eupithecia tripunctaria]